MHPVHITIASVHSSDLYMVYIEFPQLIFGRSETENSSVFIASVDHDAAWESTQGSYHTD